MRIDISSDKRHLPPGGIAISGWGLAHPILITLFEHHHCVRIWACIFSQVRKPQPVFYFCDRAACVSILLPDRSYRSRSSCKAFLPGDRTGAAKPCPDARLSSELQAHGERLGCLAAIGFGNKAGALESLQGYSKKNLYFFLA
ncbi:hypothetical protein ACSAZL_13540 [Methanosarcina sp. T3]|uniref:hypothetical protein n=1 Tax=Methanosarcina sp. T3 TaxID=3439062 RepID=UPI003F87B6AA